MGKTVLEAIRPCPPDTSIPEFAIRIAGQAVIEVSAGVIFRRGLLLITQRRLQDHLGGLWEFPGGKRHPGESDEECLHRELMEELGIEVAVKELIEDPRPHRIPHGKVGQPENFSIASGFATNRAPLGVPRFRNLGQPRNSIGQLYFPRGRYPTSAETSKRTPKFWR